LTRFSVFVLALIGVFLLRPPGLYSQPDQTRSQCVQCHANLKKLIRLCWEVEKIKPRTKTSTETAGEG
jgi:hypothetical protein